MSGRSRRSEEGCHAMTKYSKIISILLTTVVLYTELVQAQGPTVNWDTVRNYSVLAVKITVTATGILIFVTAFIKSALAVLRKQLGGALSTATAQRELIEALEGPLYWLIALAFAAWLPDILVAIGLLPQGTPFAVNWNEIFNRP